MTFWDQFVHWGFAISILSHVLRLKNVGNFCCRSPSSQVFYLSNKIYKLNQRLKDIRIPSQKFIFFSFLAN